MTWEVNPESVRPIKLTVNSQATALEMLRNSNKLKSVNEYKYVYIQPNINLQERSVHKNLVNELETKIKDEPNKYQIIKDGVLYCIQKIPLQKEN